MQTIRNYKHEDYELLKKWFKEWDNWTPCPETSIPTDGGFMYCEDNIPKMFMCYYKTQTDIAVMGFTIKDKNFIDDNNCVSLLFNHMKEDGIENGVRVIFYATDNESKHFVDKFTENGGVVTDHGDAYISCMPLDKTYPIDFFECKEE